MRDWATTFLASLSETPNVSEACRSADITRQTAYEAKASDPEFAKAWADALESSTDDLAGEAYRRARHGTEKPVFHMGAECGRVREYSDTLTIFLLKAHRPRVYRETIHQEHSGSLDVTHHLDDALAKVYGDGGSDPVDPA